MIYFPVFIWFDLISIFIQTGYNWKSSIQSTIQFIILFNSSLNLASCILHHESLASKFSATTTIITNDNNYDYFKYMTMNMQQEFFLMFFNERIQTTEWKWVECSILRRGILRWNKKKKTTNLNIDNSIELKIRIWNQVKWKWSEMKTLK